MDDDFDLFNLGLDGDDQALSSMWGVSDSLEYIDDSLTNDAEHAESTSAAGSSDSDTSTRNNTCCQRSCGLNENPSLTDKRLVSGHHNYARSLVDGSKTEEITHETPSVCPMNPSQQKTINPLILTIRVPNGLSKEQTDDLKPFSEMKKKPGRKTLHSDTNKNAVAARMNRIKKKKYVESLEKIVQKLKSENVKLRNQMNNSETLMEAMSGELKYLKGVLGNIDEISCLVRGLKSIPGINLAKNVCDKKMESVELDFKSRNVDVIKGSRFSDDSRVFADKKYKAEPMEQEPEKSGICLHIGGGNISLELCRHCSQSGKGNGHHT